MKREMSRISNIQYVIAPPAPGARGSNGYINDYFFFIITHLFCRKLKHFFSIKYLIITKLTIINNCLLIAYSYIFLYITYHIN